MISDQQLWPRILEGDAAAWEILVRRYQPLVYAVASRAGLSLADCADCFQQTWVLLYKYRGRMKDVSRLSAWLVTTAKREALRLRKRAARDTDDPVELTLLSPRPLPDEELLLLERQAQFQIALNQLDTRCRDYIRAFFFAEEDKSYEEIARDFGIPANSLGAIRRRCLDRLRAILVEMEYLEERKED